MAWKWKLMQIQAILEVSKNSDKDEQGTVQWHLSLTEYEISMKNTDSSLNAFSIYKMQVSQTARGVRF